MGLFKTTHIAAQFWLARPLAWQVAAPQYDFYPAAGSEERRGSLIDSNSSCTPALVYPGGGVGKGFELSNPAPFSTPVAG